MLETCGVKVNFTWKEHILTGDPWTITVLNLIRCFAVHLKEWLDQNQEGLAKYSEQAGEAIHHSFKVILLSVYCITDLHHLHLTHHMHLYHTGT